MTRRITSGAVIFRVFTVLAACLLVSGVMDSQVVAKQDHGKGEFPNIQLGKSVRGAEAIAALGGRLPEVAHWYGSTADDLRSAFQDQRDLWLDTGGRMLYACENLALGDGTETAGAGEIVAQGLAPLGETFLLHSNPGSTKCVNW